MRILLLDDDPLQVNLLTEELRRNFSDVEVQSISTESDFRKQLDDIERQPPDIFVFDMMVRWANAAPNLEPPPPEIISEGYYRAGIRCQKLLSEREATKSVPVIFYTVLDRGEFQTELPNPLPNVVTINKETEGRLSSVIRSLSLASSRPDDQKPGVFLVHGHDNEAKESVARFIERLGLGAVVLHEQPSMGRTIIEKFEAHTNVSYAVVLLTPDDLGRSKAEKTLRGRARQNVVFELGYFAAKLGRRNMCALFKPHVEIPSDFQGVLYVEMDSAGAWRATLAREMRAAGLPINVEKIL